MKRKRKPEELVRHIGCKDCNGNCIFNRPVTTKSKNQQASVNKYTCNTTKNKL